MRTKVKRENDKKKIVLVTVILIISIMGTATLIIKKSLQNGTELLMDSNARLGQLKGKSHEEIVKELNKIVEEGTFNISINANPQFERGDLPGDIQIENVPSNRYLMKVEIDLDGTNEKIYQSGLIDVNHHIQEAKLDKILEKGKYPATARFTAYDRQTRKVIGHAAAYIVISILN